jgi:hypothetical protein
MSNEFTGRWLITGALLGVAAGVVFALFEMLAAWAMGDGFWMPLRMIGAIVLGKEALEPSYSLTGAALTGAVLHMALSALYGTVFAALVAVVRGLRSSGAVLVAAASLYGLTLWLVNFYAIAPLAFEWFQDANAVVQFVAHVAFYGALLGILLAARLPLGAHAPRPRRQPLGV